MKTCVASAAGIVHGVDALKVGSGRVATRSRAVAQGRRRERWRGSDVPRPSKETASRRVNHSSSCTPTTRPTSRLAAMPSTTPSGSATSRTTTVFPRSGTSYAIDPSLAWAHDEYAADARSIRRAPKVLLHEHLDGGLRPETVLELAHEVGYTSCPPSIPTNFVAGSSWTRPAVTSFATSRGSPTRQR